MILYFNVLRKREPGNYEASAKTNSGVNAAKIVPESVSDPYPVSSFDILSI